MGRTSETASTYYCTRSPPRPGISPQALLLATGTVEAYARTRLEHRSSSSMKQYIRTYVGVCGSCHLGRSPSNGPREDPRLVVRYVLSACLLPVLYVLVREKGEEGGKIDGKIILKGR